jgi:hypothetical protein
MKSEQIKEITERATEQLSKWLERTGGSPRDVSQRQLIRSILSMPVSR